MKKFQLQRYWHVGVLAAASLVAGCNREWHLSFISANTFGPTFCLSRNAECVPPGIQLNIISVRQVVENGAAVDATWLIQGKSESTSDYVIGRLKYGTTPVGWVELSPAKAIKVGVYYSLNDEFYFIRHLDDSYLVLTRDEYFHKR